MTTPITTDVVVVGCGISGITTGYHLKTYCPGKKFVILERREKLGGTWDFFKYPGIRSDSDMYSFGFNWKKWTANASIATKSEILKYLNNAVDEEGLREYIHFQTNVTTASFSTKKQMWTLETNEGRSYISKYVMFNTGYYSYEQPYTPDFKGVDKFKGDFVHPQTWPKDLNYKGKKIVVIGSGATAATLIPALVNGGASSVTMLQRSPSYFIAREKSRDGDMYSKLKPYLGENIAYYLKRWQSILFQWLAFELMQKFKVRAKKFVVGEIRRQCPTDFDVDTHFNPSYGVWDQRLCLVPDGDFFKCLHHGKANVVTDHVDHLVDNGIKTRNSGEIINADIIVSATGLTLQKNFPMSTIQVDVDGIIYDAPEHYIYNGCMLDNIPNFMFVIGYSNHGWTLKADYVAMYFCNIINYMNNHSFGTFCPSSEHIKINENTSLLGLSSGYLMRAQDRMPKQGIEEPWVVSQNVVKDFWTYKIAKYGPELIFDVVKKTNTEGSVHQIHSKM
jgi:monooxygenase